MEQIEQTAYAIIVDRAMRKVRRLEGRDLETAGNTQQAQASKRRKPHLGVPSLV